MDHLQPTRRYVDLTPTPEEMRRIVEILRAQMTSSQETIAQAQQTWNDLDAGNFQMLPSATALLQEALECLIAREEERIGRIKDGLQGGERTQNE